MKKGSRGCRFTPWKAFLIACSAVAVLLLSSFEQPAVRVQGADAVGPRPLEKATQTAVVRDYLNAWTSLSEALGENRAAALDAAFVGLAKEQLSETVKEQQDLGIKTGYRDTSHDIRLIFYSPEGLSIQLMDTVEYEMKVQDHDQVRAVQQVRTRYVAVLTPTELRWKVRVFQALPD